MMNKQELLKNLDLDSMFNDKRYDKDYLYLNRIEKSKHKKLINDLPDNKKHYMFNPYFQTALLDYDLLEVVTIFDKLYKYNIINEAERFFKDHVENNTTIGYNGYRGDNIVMTIIHYCFRELESSKWDTFLQNVYNYLKRGLIPVLTDPLLLLEDKVDYNILRMVNKLKIFFKDVDVIDIFSDMNLKEDDYELISLGLIKDPLYTLSILSKESYNKSKKTLINIVLNDIFYYDITCDYDIFEMFKKAIKNYVNRIVPNDDDIYHLDIFYREAYNYFEKNILLSRDFIVEDDCNKNKYSYKVISKFLYDYMSENNYYLDPFYSSDLINAYHPTYHSVAKRSNQSNSLKNIGAVSYRYHQNLVKKEYDLFRSIDLKNNIYNTFIYHNILYDKGYILDNNELFLNMYYINNYYLNNFSYFKYYNDDNLSKKLKNNYEETNKVKFNNLKVVNISKKDELLKLLFNKKIQAQKFNKILTRNKIYILEDVNNNIYIIYKNDFGELIVL